MKTTLILTAVLIGGIALPAAVFAGPTENITGCATVAVEGANYTTTVVPGCLKSTENKDGSTFILAGLGAVIEDMAEDEADKKAK